MQLSFNPLKLSLALKTYTLTLYPIQTLLQ